MSSQDESQNNNPFPGLRPFLEDEEYLFFGRESQVDAMVDKLAQTRFLSVVGTSGSGKSSLVNCGLQPALRSGLMASAGTNWRIAKMRPGGDPLPALAEALGDEGVLFSNYPTDIIPLDEIIDITLRISKLGLIDIVNQAKLGDGVNLLLVVDQFEELFRYKHLGNKEKSNNSGNIEEATEFVNLLLAAVEQAELPIYIVLTMRSDFLGDCAQFVGLAEAMNNGQYLVPRLTRDQRRSAISGPVGVGGASIEPVLLTRLVNDVGDNPDQLSILQHALNRTWSYWENEAGAQGPLSLAHYEAIGSMEGALDKHAEKAYTEVIELDLQTACRKMFKALTDKATDPRGIRRPTTLGNLSAITESSQSDLIKVIEVFRKPSRSFLMPPATVSLEPNTVIDISHESLMRVWVRLDKWASQEAMSAQTYRRLAETATLYQKENAGLLRDADLRVVQQWRKYSDPNEFWGLRYKPGYNDAMAFLQTSEKAQQRKKNLYRGLLSIAMLGLVTAAVSYAYIANNKAGVVLQKAEAVKQEAEQAKEEAETNEVALLEKVQEVEAKTAKLEIVKAEVKAVIAEADEIPMESKKTKVESVIAKAKATQSLTNSSSLARPSAKPASLPVKLRDKAKSNSKSKNQNKSISKTEKSTLKPSALEGTAEATEVEAPVADNNLSQGVKPSEASSALPPLAESIEQTTTIAANNADSFVTCDYVDVKALVATGCGAKFKAGRVYFFARLVTRLDEETLILKWLQGDKVLHEKALNIRQNSSGFRTYAWKTFKSGDYRACLYDQNENEIQCTEFAVK